VANDTETVILTQPADERLELDHGGAVALQHVPAAGQPLVHMICWEEEESCPVEVSGGLTVSGNPDAPVELDMQHHFHGVHHQHLAVDPVEHGLLVHSALAEPIHHALQMRTPLQVRFCNSWHVASDYTIDVRAGKRSLFSIRISGTTVGTPEPCADDDPCPPVITSTTGALT
jgi:hypothetical protein